MALIAFSEIPPTIIVSVIANRLTNNCWITTGIAKPLNLSSLKWRDSWEQVSIETFLTKLSPQFLRLFLFMFNLLIYLASIYWWMHLHLCHDLNGILDTSIVLLLNLLFLHSYICNNDRSGCSHRMYPLSWQPFHTTELYILAVL